MPTGFVSLVRAFCILQQISDQGGGIRRSELDLLFNYMYSTAPRPPSPDAADSTPLVSDTI